MCGRYRITINKSTIERHFTARSVSGQQEFHPTYNAVKSQLLPIITTEAPGSVVLARWGFVPEHWHGTRLWPQNNVRYEHGGVNACRSTLDNL
jgi:putative SOS response-associated peptidase YedK